MRPHELLERDCQHLDWARVLRWPSLLLAVAALFYARSAPEIIPVTLAAACVVLAATAWFYLLHLEAVAGYLEDEE